MKNVKQRKAPAMNDARIWDRFADRYAAKPVADQQTYLKNLAITREHLRPDAEVLELGCGTGSTALAHAPYVKRIRAVDFSPKMIEIARRKAVAADIDNIEFQCKHINNIAASNESIDAVLMLSLLYLLADWRQQITMAHRVLKPGGIFVTNTLCLGGSYSLLRLIAPVGRAVGLVPQLSFFTPDELQHTMTTTGFEIEQTCQPKPTAALFMIARKLL